MCELNTCVIGDPAYFHDEIGNVFEKQFVNKNYSSGHRHHK